MSVDLTGIAIVDKEMPWLAKTKANVQAQAKDMLKNGLEMQVHTSYHVVFYIVIFFFPKK